MKVNLLRFRQRHSSLWRVKGHDFFSCLAMFFYFMHDWFNCFGLRVSQLITRIFFGYFAYYFYLILNSLALKISILD